jgi:hypothetical protein
MNLKVFQTDSKTRVLTALEARQNELVMTAFKQQTLQVLALGEAAGKQVAKTARKEDAFVSRGIRKGNVKIHVHTWYDSHSYALHYSVSF